MSDRIFPDRGPWSRGHVRDREREGLLVGFGNHPFFIGGIGGALGALGVILALAFGGLPNYVMPMVFGGAPVVNTLVTSWLGKTFNKITPLFVIGMVLVGVGMMGVLVKKPALPNRWREASRR